MRRNIIYFCVGIIFSVQPLLGGLSLLAKCACETTEASSKTGVLKKGLIILVKFPNLEHTIQRKFVQKIFFEDLNDYVRQMSYDKVCIGGDVTKKWHQMPHPISHYKISPRNLEVDRSRVKNLINDAINAVDKNVDFSKYDFVVIFMAAQRKEYGMLGLCGYPGMLGWSAKEKLTTKGGQTIRGGIAIFTYQAHLGTLFHDIAHILGGVKEGKRVLPCLYDHDLQAKSGSLRKVFIEATINMGFWDPMSCHYYKWNIPPPGISSWTKLRLNWVDPSKIKLVEPHQTKEVILGPLEEETSETLVIKIPLSKTTFYLIENRQPIGFDKYLPASGVLVMYADDKVAECRRRKAPVKLINADSTISHLRGAAFDMGKKDSFIDEENGLKIQLLEKIGNSYKIIISPYTK